MASDGRGLPSLICLDLRMWLLTAFGYERYRVSHGYSAGENIGDVAADKLELDEIKVAGCLLIGGLLKLAETLDVQYAKHALLLICDLNYFKTHVKPPTPSQEGRSTASKWWNHMQKLGEWKVITWVAREHIKFIHSFFAVAKSCGLVARAIFNGKLFSSKCAVPPGVNLPDVAELLKALSDAFAGRKFSFMTADWRHWFFQFSLADEIRPFFGMRIGDLFCRFSVLPMGFSFSPYIAQSVGWLIIIESLKRSFGQTCVEGLLHQSQLPSFIKIHDGSDIIVIALWYDNVGFFCTSDNKCMKFAKQFRATCSDFNVVIKEWYTYTSTEMELVDDREDPKGVFDEPPIRVPNPEDPSAKPPATYLGLELGWRKVRINPRRCEYRLEWRHALARRMRWWTSAKKLSSTCRSVAHLVGIIVWHCHMRLDPLAYVKTSIDILRKSVQRKESWDAVNVGYQQDLENLNAEVRRLCRDASWYFKNRPSSGKVFFVSSDASSKKWGFLVHHSDFKLWFQDHGTFTESLRGKHIFVKELLAATLGIERLCATLQPDDSVEIFIAVDNTAAAAVLRRLYSTTEAGAELVLRVIRALDDRHILRVISLRSEDNPSDPLTRNKDLCPKRAQIFQDVCLRFLEGYHKSEAPTRANPTRTHQEKEEADGYSSDEVANEWDEDCQGALHVSPEDDEMEEKS